MRLLLKIAFIGTNYAGYQAQTEFPSVQVTLTEAVSKTFGFPCTVTGCSRTDAGVHALGFCAAVSPKDPAIAATDWLTVPCGKVHRLLARELPDDIAVCGEALMEDESFHPRYSVTEKTYQYRMYDTAAEDPFLRGRAWHLKRPVTPEGISRMNEAASFLTGRHDFTSFMAAGSKITDAVRTVRALDVRRKEKEIVLSVTADGFLYNMVRIITGTLVDVAAGTIGPAEVSGILEACDRTRAGRTAPPDGLYLTDVRYDRDIVWLSE